MADTTKPATDSADVPESKEVHASQDPVSSSSTHDHDDHGYGAYDHTGGTGEKQPWWKGFFIMGHVLQIITAAVIAIAIGLSVSSTVDEVPESARVILGIPGELWLRALQAIVIPLIICAMILAIQRLRAMSKGAVLLARWTVGWYVITTIYAVALSVIMTSLVWEPRFQVADEDALTLSSDQEDEFPDPEERPAHSVVQTLFRTFITDNVFSALANTELLSILIVAIAIGYLINDPDSILLKLVVEFERMITRVIVFLIKLAPIGVFFLILPNIMRLDITDVGTNLGYLIGGTLTTMAIHVFIVLPALFFGFTRRNPYAFWIKIAPAWITAWGTASSAATLPVTLRVAKERGIPETVYKFTVPLGCLINMDGTSIYFPMAVVFLAATQGHDLQPTDYVLIVLLSTLSAIGTTPIPSSSLVLTVMIANSIDVPLTGMYGLILAIDWFLDRFRTAINVSGDLFASVIIQKMTKIVDEDVHDEALPPALREQRARERAAAEHAAVERNSVERV